MFESPHVRDFRFEKSFFSENSPWRQEAKAAALIPHSDIHCYATFEILRQGSLIAIARDFAQDKIDAARFRTLFERFAQGGHLQVPAINAEIYTFPIFRAERQSSGKTMDIVLRQYTGEDGYDTDSLPGTRVGDRRIVSGLPSPAVPIRPSDPKDQDSDGALILFDTETDLTFDYWQATVKDDKGNRGQGGATGRSIAEAGSVAKFDVGPNGLGAQTPEERPKKSARATGLPYLAGLLIPEDLERVEAGSGCDLADLAVNHALAFVLPSMRYLKMRFPKTDFPLDYVYPAGNLEKSFGTVNPYALAAGQRIRLRERIYDSRASLVDESLLKPITRIFLNTLRNHGAYLVDGGMAFAFAAEDFHTARDLRVKQVKWLVGAEESAPLPDDKTAWQYVVEELQDDLYGKSIPFAAQDPSGDVEGMILSNFDVVESSAVP
jgi:hypothetical protein